MFLYNYISTLYKPSNALWDLLTAKQPDEDAIMTCIDDHPSYCALAIDDELPIHRTIRNRLSMDVIRKVISCYPECCMKKYKENLLLHHILNISILGAYTIDNEYIVADIILNIIDIYPDAIRIVNGGLLPLHIECGSACRCDIIMKLVNIYPEALSIACDSYESGYLSLHCALSNLRSTSEAIIFLIDQYPAAVFAEYEYSLSIHYECCQMCRYDVIKKLLDIYPESISIVDEHGQHPLHIACNNSDNQFETIMYLIDLCHDIVRMDDSCGNYPIHIECRKQCRYDVITKLLEIYPDAVSMPVTSGAYSLHLAIASESTDFKAISMLITRYPAAVEALSPSNAFMMMFDRYYGIYELNDNFELCGAQCLIQIKAIALHILNLYPSALCIQDNNEAANFDIQSNPRRYRILLNLASHHLSLPQHIHVYHDMNYKARSPLLHLLLQLSASPMFYKLNRRDNIDKFIREIKQYRRVDKMKHVWICGILLLAGCKVDEDDHNHYMDASYGWMKGDDLGQHLLRYVAGYL